MRERRKIMTPHQRKFPKSNRYCYTDDIKKLAEKGKYWKLQSCRREDLVEALGELVPEEEKPFVTKSKAIKFLIGNKYENLINKPSNTWHKQVCTLKQIKNLPVGYLQGCTVKSLLKTAKEMNIDKKKLAKKVKQKLILAIREKLEI